MQPAARQAARDPVHAKYNALTPAPSSEYTLRPHPPNMLAALAPAVLALLAAGASAQQPFSVTKMGYGDAGIPGGATLNFGISGVMERMPMKNDDEAEHEAEPDEHDEHEEHEEHADHDEHDVEVEQEDDMHVGTWWYAAHQAEMEAQEQNPDQEYKEGPVRPVSAHSNRVLPLRNNAVTRVKLRLFGKHSVAGRCRRPCS
jgi:hypothetical protein